MPGILVTASRLLAISSLASAFVSIPVQRNGPGRPPLVRRNAWEQTLINNLTGGGYYTQVSLGTPPQDVTLILDTGSSDVWVLDKNADLCVSQSKQRNSRVGGCIQTYDKTQSTSYELVSTNGFSIEYLSGEQSAGDYIRENFHIGGATIQGLQMGLAETSDINSGLIGVGFSNSVSAREVYPNIMDEFKSQGLISTTGYSLWLNDLSSDTGNILFGGIDTEKFIGSIDVVPILQAVDGNYYHFYVEMSSLVLTSPSGAFEDTTIMRGALPVVLDSGTTISYLPSDIVNDLFTTLNAFDDTTRTGLVFVSCSLLDTLPDMVFSFSFADATSRGAARIAVPIREMVLDNVRSFLQQGFQLPSDVPFSDDDACSLGLQAIDGGGAASRGGNVIDDIGILGDTFLRSAYVVYDLDNKEIGLAQANLNSSTSNIVEMTNGIPVDATGVASQIPYTATASLSLSVTTDATGGPITVTITSATDDENAAPRLNMMALWQGSVMVTVIFVSAVVGGLMVAL